MTSGSITEEKTEESRTAPRFQKWETHGQSRIRRVVAVMSGKGGVGKSSVTGMLAVALKEKGRSVGILDADITGPTIPQMFGVFDVPEVTDGNMVPVTSKRGIGVMSLALLLSEDDAAAIWRAPLVTGTIKRFWENVIWGQLDYLLVDLPPGTGDAPLSVMQSFPLDGVIIVSSPQKVAVGVVTRAITMAKRMNVPILGLVENMSYVECTDCGQKLRVFGPSRGEELAERYGIQFLGALPLDPQLTELADGGQIEEYESSLFSEIAEQLINDERPQVTH